MDNGYYVDVVTKNILSALSEHISDAISDQLIGVVKKTTAQLESKIFTMFDSVSKDLANSIHDNMIGFKDRLEAIDSVAAGINEIRQKLNSVNTEQIDVLAKSVEFGLATIVAEIKASLGENNKAQLESIRATIEASGGKIERIDATLVSSLASVEDKINALRADSTAIMEALAGKIERIDSTLANSLASVENKINDINAAKDDKAATQEEMKSALRAEFKTMEGYLSSARTDQSEILRMMLEGEFRAAEAMAERVHINKKDIEERLNRLNGFIEGTAEGR
ncbi:MAG: hypothetical protein HQL01_04675 [Nitrospirae bacterium]|nr:hypothetical protein [Nitrospirota bacterium]